MFLSTGVVNMLTLVRQIILARLLFPEAFGLMSICAIVLRGVNVFTEMGIAPALIYRQQNFEEAKDTAFTMVVFRGLLLSSVLFVVAPFVADFYDEKSLTLFLRVISIALVLDGCRNINLVALQKHLNFKKISIIEQSVALISTIGVIVLAWYFRSVWALVIGHVFTSAAHLIASYAIVSGRIRFYFNRKIAGELFRYGKFITGMSIILFIVNEMDNAVIGKVLGMEMLGYYVVAFLLADLPVKYLSRVVSKIMFPAYTELQNRPRELKDTYLLTVQFVSSVTVPAAFGLMALAPEIIGLVYGEKWMPAVGPLKILAFFGACRSITSLNGYLLNGIGRPHVNFYITFLRLGLLSAVVLPFTLHWGLSGVAMAVLLPMIVQMVTSTFLVYKFIGAHPLEILRSAGVWIACSALMAYVLLLTKSYFTEVTLLLLVFLIFFGMAIYFILTAYSFKALIRRLINAAQNQ